METLLGAATMIREDTWSKDRKEEKLEARSKRAAMLPTHNQNSSCVVKCRNWSRLSRVKFVYRGTGAGELKMISVVPANKPSNPATCKTM